MCKTFRVLTFLFGFYRLSAGSMGIFYLPTGNLEASTVHCATPTPSDTPKTPLNSMAKCKVQFILSVQKGSALNELHKIHEVAGCMGTERSCFTRELKGFLPRPHTPTHALV